MHAKLQPAWKIIEEDGMKKLEKKFMARNFADAMDFLVKAGEIAEVRGHHPDLHLTSYRYVRVVVYTHSLSGLTENDFNLATEIDTILVVTRSDHADK